MQFDRNNIASVANDRTVRAIDLNNATSAPFKPSTPEDAKALTGDGRIGYGGHALVPRLIRLRDAPYFFGMDKNRFNREVRPLLTEIRIGRQGRAFDRLEMEAAAEDYKARTGRPTANLEGRRLWDKANRQASPSVVRSGISIKTSSERAFAKALERAISRKP